MSRIAQTVYQSVTYQPLRLLRPFSILRSKILTAWLAFFRLLTSNLPATGFIVLLVPSCDSFIPRYILREPPFKLLLRHAQSLPHLIVRWQPIQNDSSTRYSIEISTMVTKFKAFEPVDIATSIPKPIKHMRFGVASASSALEAYASAPSASTCKILDQEM